MSNRTDLKKIELAWAECAKCPIGTWAYYHVFWRGDPNATIVFVGEGPGRGEDAIGEPFVGRAGRLLDAAIKESGQLPEACFFTNLVSCRPTDREFGPNRAPTMVEASNCRDRLAGTLGVVKPRAIAWLGQVTQEYAAWYNNLAPAPIHFFLPHPAWLLRSGGEASKEYPRYVTKLKEIFKYA